MSIAKIRCPGALADFLVIDQVRTECGEVTDGIGVHFEGHGGAGRAAGLSTAPWVLSWKDFENAYLKLKAARTAGGDLKAWKNRVVDVVIAKSPEDADAVMRAMYGGDYDPDGGAGEWKECQPDKPFTILIDGGPRKETKTFAEWIASNGRGFLATTEF